MTQDEEKVDGGPVSGSSNFEKSIQPTNSSLLSSDMPVYASVPASYQLIENEFTEGPLGLTLQLSSDMRVYVATIAENSQADGKIKLYDELWEVHGGSFIGLKGIDRPTWLMLVEELKGAPRPLKLSFLRYDEISENAHAHSSLSEGAITQKATTAIIAEAMPPIPPVSTSEKAADGIPPDHPESDKSYEKAKANNNENKNGQTSKDQNSKSLKENRGELDESFDLPLEALIERMHISHQNKVPSKGVAGLLNKASGLLNQTGSHMLQPQVFTSKDVVDRCIGEDAGRGDSEVTARELLFKEGRHMVRSGPIRVLQTGALWTTSAMRYLFLFNDVLVVSAPTAHITDRGGVDSETLFEVLNIQDLRTCSLVSKGMNFGDGAGNRMVPPRFAEGAGGDDDKGGEGRSRTSSSSQVSPDYHCLLEIHTPCGALHCCMDSVEERDMWALALFCSICDSVEEHRRVLGWRHQCLRGTLMSAIVKGDLTGTQELLSELLEARGRDALTLSVNTPDEDGFTALHYSCILRHLHITKLLLEAGADPTLPDADGLCAIHWTALQLDDLSMSVLLSRTSKADLLDGKHRTPLYLACAEGRGLTGSTDTLALRRCLTVLLAMQASPESRCLNEGTRSSTASSNDSQRSSPAQLLAGSWQHEPLEALLDAGADCNALDPCNGYSALHYAAAALPLKSQVGEAARKLAAHDGASAASSDFEEPSAGCGIPTLRALLKAGARPNAPTREPVKRGVDAMPTKSKDVDKGLTAIYLIYLSRDIWGDDYEPAVSLLLEHGARIEPQHELSGVLMQSCPGVNFDGQKLRFAEDGELDGALACVTPECFVSQSLRTEAGEILTPADLARPASPSGKVRSRSSSSGPPSADCDLCAAHFSFFKRKYMCRLCNCVACDDCSKHRVRMAEPSASSPISCRVCDACFNRCKAQVVVREARRVSRLSSRASSSSIVEDDSQKTRAMSKDKLFEGSAQPVAPIEASAQSQGQMNATTATLVEVGDRLKERGEMLKRLDDKSAELSSAANDFAAMAAKLNQKSRSWF